MISVLSGPDNFIEQYGVFKEKIDMAFCPRCGTQSTEWEQVCRQCSSPLPNRPAENPYGAQPPMQQPPPQMPPYGAPPVYGGYQQQPAYGYGAPYSGAYASIGKRIAAVLLDGLLGFAAEVPGFVFIAIGAASAGPSGRLEGGAAALFFLGYFIAFVGALGIGIYNIYLLGRDGASLGKRWMHIKVLDPAGQPLGFGKAFLREFLKGLIGGLCFILWLWPLWDKEQQGLHDKIFGTHVYDA